MAARKANGISVDIFEPISSRLILKHPATGEPVPDLWVDAVGPESEEYRAAIRKIARQDTMRKESDDKVEEAEHRADQSLGLLAACIVGWNEEAFGEFDKDRAKDLLKKYPSLTRQVDEFVGERKNFFRRS